MKFKGSFREVLRVFTKSRKCVSRKLYGCFKKVSRKFQGKYVSRKFHKKFQACSTNLSMKFILQICCSMNLIAATRADGGLFFNLQTLKYWPKKWRQTQKQRETQNKGNTKIKDNTKNEDNTKNKDNPKKWMQPKKR